MIVVVCPPFFGLYTGFKKNFNLPFLKIKEKIIFANVYSS